MMQETAVKLSFILEIVFSGNMVVENVIEWLSQSPRLSTYIAFLSWHLCKNSTNLGSKHVNVFFHNVFPPKSHCSIEMNFLRFSSYQAVYISLLFNGSYFYYPITSHFPSNLKSARQKYQLNENINYVKILRIETSC